MPAAPAAGCGSVPQAPVKDPDGVVAALGAKYKAGFSGYGTPVLKSAWANWKPTHPGPYTIGIEWNAVTTDFQQRATSRLQKLLKASPMVKDVIFQSTGNNLDVAQQIAQTNQLINRKPDLVILEVLTADSFVPQINRLGAMGIPTIVAMDSSVEGNKYAVNVQPNAYAALAQATAYLMRMLKGTGNVVFFHGLASTGVDRLSYEGFKAALKRCPGAKQAGQLYGDFTTANAKSEFLKFLATHPQPINAVAETAGTSAGVLSALQQTGRTVVPAMMNGANAGTLSYWSQNKKTYQNVGYSFGGDALADALQQVTLRMLDGQGIKLTDVSGPPPLITNANVDTYAPKEKGPVFTPTDAPTPVNSFVSADYVAGLFNNPRDIPAK